MRARRRPHALLAGVPRALTEADVGPHRPSPRSRELALPTDTSSSRTCESEPRSCRHLSTVRRQKRQVGMTPATPFRSCGSTPRRGPAATQASTSRRAQPRTTGPRHPTVKQTTKDTADCHGGHEGHSTVELHVGQVSRQATVWRRRESGRCVRHATPLSNVRFARYGHTMSSMGGDRAQRGAREERVHNAT
ncbi:hypothetical protein GALL_321560 [mine drainage metagenome]|uniref:Uncharacterized protein n=1 Tax=mine drainage metagenome TaxID=410659 RepID=A0A1J5QRF5_9ZZZZ